MKEPPKAIDLLWLIVSSTHLASLQFHPIYLIALEPKKSAASSRSQTLESHLRIVCVDHMTRVPTGTHRPARPVHTTTLPPLSNSSTRRRRRSRGAWRRCRSLHRRCGNGRRSSRRAQCGHDTIIRRFFGQVRVPRACSALSGKGLRHPRVFVRVVPDRYADAALCRHAGADGVGVVGALLREQCGSGGQGHADVEFRVGDFDAEAGEGGDVALL